MSDLDPREQEQREKAIKGLELWTSLMGTSSKSIKSSIEIEAQKKRADQDLIKMLQREGELYGIKNKYDKEEIRLKAEQIKLDRVEAAEKEKREQKEKVYDQMRLDSMKRLGSGFTDLVKGSFSASKAMYDSDKAFTATIPTLELASGALKAIAEAAGLALSGVTILGESAGRAPEALSKLAVAAIDIGTQVAKVQLEMSQQYLDSFDKMSSAGVTFGGQLTNLAARAKEGGLNLKTYSEFISKNAEQLGNIGGNMESTADMVTKMGKNISETNHKMVMLYGGFQQVDDAIAGYLDTQSRLGADSVKDQAQLRKGAEDYLVTMKALSELTGKSVSKLKAEQDAQLADAAWQMKLAKLRAEGHPEKAAALQELYQLQLAKYGKRQADYFKEKEALDGRVISKQNQQYQAYNSVMVRVTDEFSQSANLEIKDRLRANAKTMESNEDAIAIQDAHNKTLVQLGTYGNNETTKTIAEAAGERMKAKSQRLNAAEAAEKAISNINKKLDAGGEGIVTLKSTQLTLQQQMDELTETSLPQMADVAIKLTDLQATLFDKFGGKKWTSSVDSVITGLDELAKHLPGGSKDKKSTASDAPPGYHWEQRGRAGRHLIKNEEPAAGTGASARWGHSDKHPVGSAPEAPKAPAPSKATSRFGGRGEAAPVQPGESGYGRGRGSIGDDPSRYKGLRIGGKYPGEAIAGGPANQRLIDLAHKLQEMYPDGTFNAFNDTVHGPKDPHGRGVALDFNLGFKPTDEEGKKILGKLKEIGFTGRNGDEYNHPIPGLTTGGHIHAELKNGGITNGTSIAGEAGPEAVIPLPDGRTVPVKMDTGDLVNKLDELLRVMKEHSNTSKKILHATV